MSITTTVQGAPVRGRAVSRAKSLAASRFGTVLINLDRDPDRLAHMAAELERAGLAFERTPAVLGDAFPASLDRYFRGMDGAVASPLRPGEIGCYASHLLVHQRMVQGTLPSPLLVLEDDVRLSDDLGAVVEALLDVLPEDWDIVRLSNLTKRATRPRADLPGGRRLVRYSRIPNFTGAYLISRRGAERFLNGGLRVRGVDQDMRRAWLFNLDTYGVLPPPVNPTPFASSIDAIDGGARQARFIKAPPGAELPQLPRRLAFEIASMGLKDWLGCLWENLLGSAGRRLPKTDPKP